MDELFYGVERSEYKDKNLKKLNFFIHHVQVQEIDLSVWQYYGEMKAKLHKQGTSLSDFDLLITCTAQANSYVLVSNDQDHEVLPKYFTLENWSKP